MLFALWSSPISQNAALVLTQLCGSLNLLGGKSLNLPRGVSPFQKPHLSIMSPVHTDRVRE